ncbi:LytTR family DNA-binding domain-containing protein [Pediococcus claussenii]|uniref:LytTr DNA-binding domain protein n=1 Tax=Pediococcus claussenii (strain ATCC BAA-344 / DSM 14800 / JCM 18046 / KCTC 3811 / LMG 21948 / P06) TaxID=701521 RepID=G8PEH1_PEDCP|nr:LytTR family DNA-binding domain-containing protein [Pediococcus claussenii]AEV95580.1 lytTr DNA-binding domain protein [Pediococcus claussenii ATCC BAA-344]KRN20187.1 hypothetical protein IV79_GL000853 [Pediococcus claussenii]
MNLKGEMGNLEILWDISSKFIKTFITIHATKRDSNLASSLQMLTDEISVVLQKNKRIKRVTLIEVERFFTENKRVLCEIDGEQFEVHKRIYELEKLLPSKLFMRTSSGEIIRINVIRNFELTGKGELRINLKNGKQTYSSRRYAQRIRRNFLK